jgi:hypothetical protein
MKIGIITFHRAENYGAVLQTIALQHFLEKNRPHDEIHVVDYNPKSISRTYSFFYSVKKSCGLAQKAKHFISSLLQIPFSIKKKYIFFQARNKNLSLETTNHLEDFSCLICGSDQIWNPELTDGLDPNYFGKIRNFKGKSISYAASDGGKIDSLEYSSICENVNNLTYISVRERSLKYSLLHYTNKPIQEVLDPVFLPDVSYWNCQQEEQQKSGYILVYQLSNNPIILQEAHRLSKITRKKIIELVYGVPFGKLFKTKHHLKICVSPLTFVKFFSKADFILTNSYHGTAFSIIFNKQFCTYKLQERSARITDLLQDLNLSDRYVSSSAGVIEKPINYQKVSIQLNNKRKSSISFLQESLNQISL